MNTQHDYTRRIEPGLIPTTRVFVLYWVAHWIFGSLFFHMLFEGDGEFALLQLLVLVSIHLLTFGLLCWESAQRWLDRWFLSLVVSLASIPFFLERIWLLQPVLQPNPDLGMLFGALLLFDDFVLLTLIVAWQYRFRAVALYVLFVTLGDAAITWPVREVHIGAFFDVMSHVVFRGIIYLLLGFVVTRLRGINRRQREELMEAHEAQVAANEKLTQYAAAVEQLTVSQERNRLARELHDTLAHSLSAIAVQLQAVSSLWDADKAKAQAILAKAEKLADDGLVEARRALQDLRATPLEDFGLLIALRELAESAAERADLTATIDIPSSAIPLPNHIEQSVYRILQEALENVVRHARARHLTVQMMQTSDRFACLVADDGRGFEIGSVNHSERHMGLRGMNERAELIGAKLTVESQPQQGTCISLVLELPHETNSRSTLR
ncbi:sensor histidine kinase [Chloroflexi bacterium TSY]|nr:sensor histidine kinase [Chloroflexi bacterium TSY]